MLNMILYAVHQDLVVICPIYKASIYPAQPPTPFLPQPPPTWQLKVCALYLCCFCFINRSFVSYFRFHMKVISYGICLCLTNLTA